MTATLTLHALERLFHPDLVSVEWQDSPLSWMLTV